MLVQRALHARELAISSDMSVAHLIRRRKVGLGSDMGDRTIRARSQVHLVQINSSGTMPHVFHVCMHGHGKQRQDLLEAANARLRQQFEMR